ncbi:MAG TPA: hypothetical protein VFQ61_34810 [Polyangiaceae bacterium]|nr:hypothetical protein [Polyangiaceae bacterium]
MLRFIEDYAKHAALNFGQALQGIRYLLSHPDIDTRAPRGTLRHTAHSVPLRLRRVANDLFFAALPPQWHHTQDELSAMRTKPLTRWFQYGYCAWRFDESGEPKPNLVGVDRRWDPRCNTNP